MDKSIYILLGARLLVNVVECIILSIYLFFVSLSWIERKHQLSGRKLWGATIIPCIILLGIESYVMSKIVQKPDWFRFSWGHFFYLLGTVGLPSSLAIAPISKYLKRLHDK